MELIDELNYYRHSVHGIQEIIIKGEREEFKTSYPFEDVPKKLLKRQVTGHYLTNQLPVMILTIGKEKSYENS